MGLCTKLLLVFSVLLAIVAYLVYIPVSPDLAEPLAYRFCNYLMLVSFLWGAVGSKLGFGEPMPLVRQGIDLVLPGLTPSIGPDLVEREDTLFDGVPVRIYRPKNKTSGLRGALVFYHGGGWVFGSIHSHDGLTAHYAVQANIVVVSVEYRMAPEDPYPIPFEDCSKATKFFIQNALKYKVDPKRVAVGGDSAGGNLAAAVSIMLRDTKFQPVLRSQVLIYPVTQMLDFNTPSHFKVQKLLPDRTGIATMISQYLDLPEEYIEIIANNSHMTPTTFKKVANYMDIKVLPKGFVSDDFKPTDPNRADKRVSANIEAILTDPYVSPLLAQDVSNLPEAFIFTAGQDGLRDDGAFYEHRLKKAGVKTMWLDIPETFHGCLSMTYGIFKTETGQRANADVVKFLKKTLN